MEQAEKQATVFLSLRLDDFGHSHNVITCISLFFGPERRPSGLGTLTTVQCLHNSAFHYGDLNQEIHMTPPRGYRVAGHCVKKCVYDLKQSPREWYGCLSIFLTKCDFYQQPLIPVSSSDIKMVLLSTLPSMSMISPYLV